MRRWIAPVVLSVALALAGCGGDDEPVTGNAGNADGGGSADDSLAGAADTVPSCPFTEAQATQVTGRTMGADGPCLWREHEGPGILTITLSSELAGSTTYDYQKDQAGKRFQKLSDVDKGSKGYLAAGEIEGEAVVISPKGSFTVLVSSFGGGVTGNEALLRKLVEAIPA
jgi:hypothetical protein